MVKQKVIICACAALFCVLMPKAASATNNCELISDGGLVFGAEIACGDEHFYVFDQDGENIRMLAKYNLNVGETIYRADYPDPENMDKQRKSSFCSTLAWNDNGIVSGITLSNAFYSTRAADNCYYRKMTSDGNLRQLEEARSAHWDDSGNFLYPQVGDVYVSFRAYNISPLDCRDYSVAGINTDFGQIVDTGNNNCKEEVFLEEESRAYYAGVDSGGDLEDYTLNPNTDRFYTNYNVYDGRCLDGSYNYCYLGGVADSVNEYKAKLVSAGYEVKGATIPTLNDIKQASINKGHNFNYDDWIPITYEAYPVQPNKPDFEMNMDFKQFFDEEDSWLWDRSYWLRTGWKCSTSSTNCALLFADAAGDICSTFIAQSGPLGRCSSMYGSKLPLGVRPLMTIAKSSISFKIRSETDGNGEIEVVDRSPAGESITFKTIARAGFRLKSLTVSIDGGDEFEFDEDEVGKDDAGYITVKSGVFTMPYANVLVRAAWAKVEPKTEPELVPEPDSKPVPESEPSDAGAPGESIVVNPATDDDFARFFALLIGFSATACGCFVLCRH